ncbi:hypothetical protein SAMN06272765_2173 [Streptomyces sp. Ag109_G2-15]|nr:hypothetical protein SAMN06272765_2173 [Streptomyces sp. Ag109_G2-15]
MNWWYAVLRGTSGAAASMIVTGNINLVKIFYSPVVEGC